MSLSKFLYQIDVPTIENYYRPHECPIPPVKAASANQERARPQKLAVNSQGIPRPPDLFFGDSDEARRLPPVPSFEEMCLKDTIKQ